MQGAAAMSASRCCRVRILVQLGRNVIRAVGATVDNPSKWTRVEPLRAAL